MVSGLTCPVACGMWDLSSPIRDQTHVPCIGRQILNHWTTREVPLLEFEWTGLDGLKFEAEGKKGFKDDTAALI